MLITIMGSENTPANHYAACLLNTSIIMHGVYDKFKNELLGLVSFITNNLPLFHFNCITT